MGNQNSIPKNEFITNSSIKSNEREVIYEEEEEKIDQEEKIDHHQNDYFQNVIKTNNFGTKESCIVESLLIETDKNTLWKNGIVYYVIDVKDIGLKKLIIDAINEFEIKKTPIQWVKRNNENNFVRFLQNDWEPWSNSVGCEGGEQFISICYPNFPGTNIKITMASVLHEMLHALGFYHEHSREDVIKHGIFECEKSFDNEIVGIPFGKYDYESLMHYKVNCGTGIKIKDEKMIKYIGNSKTFSEGDLAALRRIYGGPDAHFGEWHEPCTNKKCNDLVCRCGACKQLSNGVYCGFTGYNKNGHWSCCLSEDKNNKCYVKHTGYYHMKHFDKKCKPYDCVCSSCGKGCIYEGSKGHWSCCLVEDKYDYNCPRDPFKYIASNGN